jgi:C4-dicarboxylate transporter DctQ subunit
VVARYGFNSGWTGALEFTRILFAWMILFGMSYGVKIGCIWASMPCCGCFPNPCFGLCHLRSLCGVVYALTLLRSEWLQSSASARGAARSTTGRRFYKIGIGLDDLRYPDVDAGDIRPQERVQRWIAYLILTHRTGPFLFRCIQAVWQISPASAN